MPTEFRLYDVKEEERFCNQFNYSLDFVLGLTRRNIKYNKDIKLDQKQIGQNLKLLIEKSSLSQQQIADKCSIERSTYSHYEIGLSLITTLSLTQFIKLMIFQ